MSVRKLIGALLIAAGVAALVYGGFSFTRKTHKVDIGVAELKLQDKERVKIPTWAGVAAIVAGGALLAIGRK
jgi:drug/metabolite transporter (DMT)-like permease